MVIAVILNAGCYHQENHKQSIENAQQNIPIKEHAVLAVLWQKESAEYKALCYQAFNLAAVQLDKLISQNQSTKPLAIVTDVDETILDNIPYAVELINEDRNYDKKSWLAWGKKESAELIPGAADFLKYAESKGVEIFYVSNRYDIQVEETVNNLKKYDLPNADYSHVLLKSHESGKQPRRNKVSQSHEILLLLGDNLSDFDEVFDDKNAKQRNQSVDELKEQFGTRFIVFPNATYGDWEQNGIYESKRLSEKEKTFLRKAKLHSKQ